jgi:hypothetical protein
MGAGVVIQADGYLFLSMEKSSLWERSPDLDRIAQDTALPKTPHCPRHRIAQDTALPKTPHCPRHRIAQDTALPKTPTTGVVSHTNLKNDLKNESLHRAVRLALARHAGMN